MILIDAPLWQAHGTVFAHLVSDTSYAELHDFAARVGLPARAFDGDHYDVPEHRHGQCVAAGATLAPGAELVRRLNASGLRLRKRKGDRGILRAVSARLGPGTRTDVDLVASPRPVEPDKVFAAMTFVRDAAGAVALTWSERRAEWSVPGGWREVDEAPVGTGIREIGEETGLAVAPDSLAAVGWERFAPVVGPSRYPTSHDLMQVYAVQLPTVAPRLRAEPGASRPPEWVSTEEFALLAGRQFWWPLAAYLLR
jgi:8-oxo-dGTP pyrophosphatase MutT (NUDIX family)